MTEHGAECWEAGSRLACSRKSSMLVFSLPENVWVLLLWQFTCSWKFCVLHQVSNVFSVTSHDMASKQSPSHRLLSGQFHVHMLGCVWQTAVWLLRFSFHKQILWNYVIKLSLPENMHFFCSFHINNSEISTNVISLCCIRFHLIEFWQLDWPVLLRASL